MVPKFAVLVEGQEGITWQQWLALAQACEQAGIPTLLRSDHYQDLDTPEAGRAATDAWAVICALAAITRTVRLGTLVTPATFRHPSVLARMVATADMISGGRIELGLGAGWHEGEHIAHGFDYPELRTRMDILEEQLQIVLGSWSSAEPFSFDGEHYRLQSARASPKPVQRPHPPIIMGGSGGPRSLRLAATYADEYNVYFKPLEQIDAIRAGLRTACARAGRDPASLSLITTVLSGRDRRELDQRVAAVARLRGIPPAQLVATPPTGWVIGLADEVAEELARYAQVGVERFVCKLPIATDLGLIDVLGREVAPRCPGPTSARGHSGDFTSRLPAR